MKVSEVMSSSVTSVDPSDSLQTAAIKMKDADVGCLPVVERGSLQGVITDRDIVVCGVAAGRDPSATEVADCESRPVHTVDQNADIEEAARMMKEHQIRRVPVVSGSRLVGMVSLADLARRQELQGHSSQVLSHVSRPSPVGARR
jgi:CBS domain-containing protein